MTHASLLQEIDAFVAATSMAETTFGRLAVNDGKFVARLRRGKRCWPETEERVREFIRKRLASGSDNPSGTALASNEAA